MLARVLTGAVVGLDGALVDVEPDHGVCLNSSAYSRVSSM
jgi:hypothetical protein